MKKRTGIVNLVTLTRLGRRAFPEEPGQRAIESRQDWKHDAPWGVRYCSQYVEHPNRKTARRMLAAALRAACARR